MRNDGSSFESLEEAEEKILKLEYRLAQIERLESCQNGLFELCSFHVARVYCGSAP